jgi:hypothetical protein
MNRTPAILLTLALGLLAVLTSCEHEIDFDFPTAAPVVVFDGMVSNEGVYVRISHTRPMTDSTRHHSVGDAEVWITSDDGHCEQLVYNSQRQQYESATGMTGTPGHTYRMHATVGGSEYEAHSTMLPPIVVDTVYFRWLDVLGQRIYFYYIKGFDPLPDERNYMLCRLRRDGEVFKWNAHSGRSSIGGIFEYDIICSSEKDIDKGVDDDGNIPLRDGDSIRCELMSIERSCWEYFQSLSLGDRVTANAISNVAGGAQGVFVAASVTRPDTLLFDRAKLMEEEQ